MPGPVFINLENIFSIFEVSGHRVNVALDFRVGVVVSLIEFVTMLLIPLLDLLFHLVLTSGSTSGSIFSGYSIKSCDDGSGVALRRAISASSSPWALFVFSDTTKYHFVNPQDHFSFAKWSCGFTKWY